MTKYTAADFANARFAEHPDGRIAARFDYHPTRPWEASDAAHSDTIMAGDGWVPVSTRPTITESEYQAIMDETSIVYGTGFSDGFGRAGGFIVPDPEPTNLERLQRLYDDWEGLPFDDGSRFTEYLDRHGVTAPKVDHA